jgi:hypothetical protein
MPIASIDASTRSVEDALSRISRALAAYAVAFDAPKGTTIFMRARPALVSAAAMAMMRKNAERKKETEKTTGEEWELSLPGAEERRSVRGNADDRLDEARDLLVSAAAKTLGRLPKAFSEIVRASSGYVRFRGGRRGDGDTGLVIPNTSSENGEDSVELPLDWRSIPILISAGIPLAPLFGRADVRVMKVSAGEDVHFVEAADAEDAKRRVSARIDLFLGRALMRRDA